MCGPIYCLVICKSSPILAVEVDIAGICYQEPRQGFEVRSYVNSGSLKKLIKRPEKNREESSAGCGVHGIVLTDYASKKPVVSPNRCDMVHIAQELVKLAFRIGRG